MFFTFVGLAMYLNHELPSLPRGLSSICMIESFKALSASPERDGVSKTMTTHVCPTAVDIVAASQLASVH